MGFPEGFTPMLTTGTLNWEWSFVAEQFMPFQVAVPPGDAKQSPFFQLNWAFLSVGFGAVSPQGGG